MGSSKKQNKKGLNITMKVAAVGSLFPFIIKAESFEGYAPVPVIVDR